MQAFNFLGIKDNSSNAVSKEESVKCLQENGENIIHSLCSITVVGNYITYLQIGVADYFKIGQLWRLESDVP